MTKIEITVGDATFSMTMEQARGLYDELTKLFGSAAPSIWLGPGVTWGGGWYGNTNTAIDPDDEDDEDPGYTTWKFN